MKKWIPFLLCLALICALFAGCSSNPAPAKTPETQQQNQPEETKTPEETPAPTEARNPAAYGDGDFTRTPDAADLEGTWKLATPIMSIFESSDTDMTASFGDFKADAVLGGMTLTFSGDQFHAVVVTGELVDGFVGFVNEYMDYLADGGIYAMFEAQGMDRETVDANLEATGTSLDDLIASLRQSFDAEALSNVMTDAMAGSNAELDADGNPVKDCQYTLENGSLTLQGNGASPEINTVALTADGNAMQLTLSNGVKLIFARAD